MIPSINGENGHGENGRDPVSGRFVKGWKGGPGNPYIRDVARCRAEVFAAIKQGDIQEIAKKLIEKAKAGDMQAAREVLDRGAGRPDTFAALLEVTEMKTMLEQLAADIAAIRANELQGSTHRSSPGSMRY